MTKRLIATFALLAALGLSVLASTAYAQSVASPDQNKTNQDKDKWQVRGGFEYRVYPLRPTQWPDGLQTGPENCALTAAQAKKYQCKTISYEGRSYYYYTDEHGTVYARRPAVTVYSQPRTVTRAGALYVVTTTPVHAVLLRPRTTAISRLTQPLQLLTLS